MGKNKMIAKSCPKCEMQVKASLQTGSGAEEVFTPSLWYFDHLHFLTDNNESMRNGIDTLDQVAVASKSCKCGHTFFASRRGADSLARAGAGDAAAGDELRRRTARVRRSQTQFYDAQHYQKQKKRSPKKRSLSETNDESYKIKEKETTTRGRRRRALRRAQRETPAGAGSGAGAIDVAPVLKPSQLQRCRIILQEINRKMLAVTWQPPMDC